MHVNGGYILVMGLTPFLSFFIFLVFSVITSLLSSFKMVFFRVRQKQNKYPILFLTQGRSDIYPELMDLRSRTTPIAMSFAQFENLLVSYVCIF